MKGGDVFVPPRFDQQHKCRDTGTWTVEAQIHARTALPFRPERLRRRYDLVLGVRCGEGRGHGAQIVEELRHKDDRQIMFLYA